MYLLRQGTGCLVDLRHFSNTASSAQMLLSLQMVEKERGPQDVDKRLVTQLMAAGFKEKPVRLALKAAGDNPDAAMASLLVSISMSLHYM
jgi:hypothetical protein